LLTKEERFTHPSSDWDYETANWCGSVNVPVARRTLGGEEWFEIDTSAAELRNVTVFAFRHTETGAGVHMSVQGAAAADGSDERTRRGQCICRHHNGLLTDHFVEDLKRLA
jgi:hypothetical protein